MKIPDLPPDIRFPSLAASDHEFSYMVKVDAMGPHIMDRWGWDDQFQRAVHQEKLRSKPFSLIISGEKAVGTVSLERHPDHLQFGEFYILSEHRGRGLGSRVLQHCLAIADQEHLPVHLEHLLWNPVGSLYRRNGFIQTSATSSHFILTRPSAVDDGTR
jgi:GNAT superfamily N-acetyltransferase